MIQVKQVTLTDFMSHRHSIIDLPEDGLILITGDNGAGKSSVIEAVAWTLWGKTLRGSKMNQCGAYVTTDRVNVSRHKGKKGKKSGLLFTVEDEEEEREYDTMSKAQAGLEGVIGDMDLWRRTSVFSSADASHFTLATDGERKRLLEDLLGLHAFDEALLDCRAHLKDRREERDMHQRSLDNALARWSAAERRWQDAEAGLAELPPELKAGVPEALQAAREEMEALKARRATALEAQSKAVTEFKVRRMSINQLQSELKGLNHTTCPTCDQPWPNAETREAKRAEYQAALDDMLESTEKHDAVEKAKQELAEIEEEMEAVRVRGRALKSQVDTHNATVKTRERFAKQEEEAMEELQAIQVEREAHEADVAACAHQVAVLEACERVLGLKGVRSHVLGKALGGIETVANSWLARIARADAPLQLTLNPYTEKKSGGTSDAIALEIIGAGGGSGYRGASGGERRRIDVALLMALAEVAQASHGAGTNGTVFFDEVFDSLDRDGTDAVISALNDMAQERAVIVISHSDDLISRIPATQHLHVSKGTVKRQ